MKNNILVKNITNSIIFLLILLYLLLGCILHTTWMSGYGNAITILFYNLTSLNYLFVFLFPSFLLLNAYVYRTINHSNFIVRFHTRQDYFKYLLNTTFKCSTLLYFLHFIILLICLNILGCNRYTIEPIQYTNNLTFLLISMCKTYVFIILFQTISLILYMKCKNSNLANIISFGLLAFIYSSKYFMFTHNSLINSFIIVRHLMDTGEFFSNLLENLTGAMLLVIFTTVICITLFCKFVSKKEFLEKE